MSGGRFDTHGIGIGPIVCGCVSPKCMEEGCQAYKERQRMLGVGITDYQSGWLCPACGKAHAPSVRTCPDNPFEEKHVDSYTTGGTDDPQNTVNTIWDFVIPNVTK